MAVVKCAWCNRPTLKVNIVNSLGNQYEICDKCKEAHDNEICIECGDTIIGQASIKGKCYACSQAEYEEKQRRADEVAAGVDVDLDEFYRSTTGFTEEDYERWVTFSMNINDDKRLKRQRWIRSKLSGHSGWTDELIAANFANLEKLVERHIRKLIKNEYSIIYYDGAVRKKRIHTFVENIGNIYVVEVKK